MAVTYRTRSGLVDWSAAGDPVTRAQFETAFANLDAIVSTDYQGTTAARPAAGIPGRWYYATDTGLAYRDTGAAWVNINPASIPPSAFTGKGVLLAGTAAGAYAAVAAGVTGKPLVADTAQTTGMRWGGGSDYALDSLRRPKLGGYVEVVDDRGAAGGVITVDASTYNVLAISPNAAITLALANLPAAGNAYELALELTFTTLYAFTWPAGIQWPAHTAPTLVANAKNLVSVYTRDNGATLVGIPGGLDIR